MRSSSRRSPALYRPPPFVDRNTRTVTNASFGRMRLLRSRVSTGPLYMRSVRGPPRSSLLEEFRSDAKRGQWMTLRDIAGHVAEFSRDQYGSRFIQQQVERPGPYTLLILAYDC